MRRTKAYSSSCPQAVTHHSTNRALRRVTCFSRNVLPTTPRHKHHYRGATLWMILCRSLKSLEKSI